jgi:uncharacterized protein YuzE
VETPMSLKAHYDEVLDLLYLAKEGEEEETVEIQPGLNIELNKSKEIIGIEIFNASKVLKTIIKPLMLKTGTV